ncbi:hypothetical protein ABPG74_019034 [Tetrahymena malaccensis]
MINTTDRRTFYQNVSVINTGMLQVSEIHTIYWEESGKADGLPAVILHGGPGGGSSPLYRGFFDPEVYRIIQFDQRGCGKSTPFGSIEENTTWDLVGDIEKLRIHFGIDKWHIVFGGSWGSTLSVSYAESHPDRVSHLVLRGVFLSRKWENDFIYQNGTGLIFPEEFDNLKKLLTLEEQKDILHSYRLKFTDKNISLEEKQKLAIQWTKFEMSASKLLPSDSLISSSEDLQYALPLAILETHYLDNLCFLRNENQLIEDIYKIKHIPTIIIQGRYDALCPVKSAWELSTLLDSCELVVVPDSGHSCTEPGIVDGLVKATDKFKKLI